MFLAAIISAALFFEQAPTIIAPFKALDECFEFVSKKSAENREELARQNKELVCLQVIRQTI
jgi:hypothetical protein